MTGINFSLLSNRIRWGRIRVDGQLSRYYIHTPNLASIYDYRLGFISNNWLVIIKDFKTTLEMADV